MNNSTHPLNLIIQIPCFNEEHTLPETIGDLPLEIEGIDKIETLIIDVSKIPLMPAVVKDFERPRSLFAMC